jgi:hypothetical protein
MAIVPETVPAPRRSDRLCGVRAISEGLMRFHEQEYRRASPFRAWTASFDFERHDLIFQELTE